MSDAPTTDGSRDAASLRILGAFFIILGCLVLIGTFWTLDNTRAMIVNVVSGLVLAGIGTGMQISARKLRQVAVPQDTAPE